MYIFVRASRHGADSTVLLDCLQVIFYMISDNAMTQALLRETPFFAVLFPLLLTSTLAPIHEYGNELPSVDQCRAESPRHRAQSEVHEEDSDHNSMKMMHYGHASDPLSTFVDGVVPPVIHWTLAIVRALMSPLFEKESNLYIYIYIYR